MHEGSPSDLERHIVLNEKVDSFIFVTDQKLSTDLQVLRAKHHVKMHDKDRLCKFCVTCFFSPLVASGSVGCLPVYGSRDADRVLVATVLDLVAVAAQPPFQPPVGGGAHELVVTGQRERELRSRSIDVAREGQDRVAPLR